MDTVSKYLNVMDNGFHKHHHGGSAVNRNTGIHAGQIIGTIDGQQVVGLDIAKLVFQLHTVDMQTGEIVNVQLKRAWSISPTNCPA